MIIDFTVLYNNNNVYFLDYINYAMHKILLNF